MALALLHLLAHFLFVLLRLAGFHRCIVVGHDLFCRYSGDPCLLMVRQLSSEGDRGRRD